jgi:hypothetical protein
VGFLVFWPNPNVLTSYDIHFAFLKHDKNVILSFLENMHEKPLGFGCMH